MCSSDLSNPGPRAAGCGLSAPVLISGHPDLEGCSDGFLCWHKWLQLQGVEGAFYPEKIKPAEMLAWYAERLTAVEINNTFYRMPKTSIVESWAMEVSETFRFIIKASRRINHFKRLKEPEEPLEFLLAATDKLDPRLGAILFQLPPNMRCDLERMQTFLGHLPRGTPVSFEFRDESWFNEETYQLLRDRNIALCHADSEENALPFVSTADRGYLRLRQPSYSPADLAAWLERIEIGRAHV